MGLIGLEIEGCSKSINFEKVQKKNGARGRTRCPLIFIKFERDINCDVVPSKLWLIISSVAFSINIFIY